MIRFFFAAIILVTATIIGRCENVQGAAKNSAGTWQNNARVLTACGEILGFADKGTTWCWRGIPYATPPVGKLRWKAPIDPEPWTGIRSGKKFSTPASQALPLVGALGSEDCLYLNVWRPRNDRKKLPVYLFIHGGGNSLGTGNSRDYYGHAVAGESQMVYVSVNFRLGVMGWFRHPAITGSGSVEDQSGNFGTLDLIKALQWVQKNIEAFGGDPGNVTISGESGGAMDVLSLLTSPLANGLFHRAVCQSGLTLIHSVKEAEEQTVGLVKNLLIEDRKAKDSSDAQQVYNRMTATEIETYLRSKSAEEIMKRIPTIVGGMAKWYSIFADGVVIPAQGYGVFAGGNWANKVPLVIGVNKDEMKLFLFLAKETEPGTRDYELLARYTSLLWRVSGMDTVVVQMTAAKDAPPVYAYRFDWGSQDDSGQSVVPKDMGTKMGANHYAEIPFFLGMRKNQLSVLSGSTYSGRNKPGREKLTRVCLAYLANFARTGNPNGEGLPLWKPWNPAPDAEKYLILDAGYQDLRISSGSDTVSVGTIIDKINKELKEPERTDIFRQLAKPLPFGFGK